MKRFTTVLLVLFGFSILTAALLADSLELTDGKKILKVKVKNEGLLKVEYAKPGLPSQTIDSERVRMVRFDASGSEYKAARDAADNKSWAEAGELFMALADKEEGASAFRAHCLFRASDYFKMAGEWDSAIAGFTAFVNEYREHRLTPEAFRNRAICLLNRGDLDKAKQGFGLLDKLVAEKGLTGFWKFESQYWAAYMQERGSPAQAQKAYEALYAETKETYPAVANKARLRIGRVYLAEKKYTEAYDFFTQIVDNRDPNATADNEVVAAAYLGRGLCLMNAPKQGDGKSEFKRALFDMLHVVYHYSEVGTTQAEGMYWAAKCFQQLGERDAAKRAQQLFRRIQKEWPGTEWAQAAAKEAGV